MSELPSDLLARWPGRFRFVQLFVALDDPDRRDRGTLTDAVLAGIVAAQDERAVVTELIDDGQFASALRFIDQCTALAADVSQLYEKLDASRATYLQKLSDRLLRLRHRSTAACLRFDIDEEDLKTACDVSWAAAEERLTSAATKLDVRIAAEADKLRERMAGEDLPANAVELFDRLLADGKLRAAAYIVEHRDPDLQGPEEVPPLPAWIWTVDSPDEVLRWYLEPGLPRPAEFASWADIDESARQLLADYDRLSVGGEVAAQDFAASLDRFLGPFPGPPVVNPIPGGYLTKLRNVFRDEDLAALRPVELFVADQDTTSVPTGMGAEPIIAVGRSIEANGGAMRGTCAVLGLRDLLRLVTVRDRRRVSLLRILGRQWPPAAFGAGSPTQLSRTLPSEPAARWRSLCWITDLAGLGGVLVAEALAFQTAYDPRLLQVFVDHLSGSGRSLMRLDGPNQWHQDEQLAAAVESAMVHSIQRSPFALAAFWTAMGSQSPGEEVSLDRMVLTLALHGNGKEWERELRSGIAELADCWFVESVGVDRITLRSCGAIVGLASVAERRIREIGAQLDDAEALSEIAAPTAWAAYRYALGTGWPEYERLRSSGDASGEALTAALCDLVMPDDDLLDDITDLAGEVDAAQIAGEMGEVFATQHPGIELSVVALTTAPTAVSGSAMRVMLYELLANAADSVGGSGSISLVIKLVEQDVLIDVQDSGPGISAEIDNSYRLFRRGVSTRGGGRGVGLYLARRLARRVDGEVDLIARTNEHPVFSGAHFQLILPRP
ncbi:MAG TPA: ATP-binding protein [Actinophytocola sp.]|jgi:signal transduction histidine kinase|nr:ATP-binding protein [Actinophytocola sp.]